MLRRSVLVCAACAALSAGLAAADEDPIQPTPIPAAVERMERSAQHDKKRPARVSGEVRTPDDFSKPWTVWEHASGDWDGARPWLHENGIVPGLTYTAEVFAKIAGGAKSGEHTEGLGHLDVDLTLHTHRLGLWQGGTAFVYFEHLDGHGVSAAAGSFQPVSTLEAPDVTHLGGYYYAQEFWQRRLSLQVGKIDANAYFDESTISGWFVNGGISPADNIPMPTYPDQAFGFTAFFTPIDEVDLRAGAYGADPDENSIGDSGFFDGRIFWIAEAAVRPPLPNHRGTYRVGGWQRRADTPDISGGRIFSDDYGVYLLFDQMLVPETPGIKSEQGLTAFVQFSWAPSDRNQNDRWAGGGFMYTGLFTGRDNDRLGFGVADAHLTVALDGAGSGNETALEWFYQVQATPWLSIQPDLQLILSPGGDSSDALVIGTRATTAF